LNTVYATDLIGRLKYVGSKSSDEWKPVIEGNVYVRNLSILNQTETNYVLYFDVFSLPMGQHISPT